MPPRIVEVRQNLLKKNDELARALRDRFERAGVSVVNLVSSPGTGKTALLETTLRALQPEFRVAALVGDLATDRDARRLDATGARIQQITTGTVCHLDAAMIDAAIASWNLEDLDFLFLENVGNLVCPASYDLGEALRVVLLSVTEGEDKPLKYPTIFNGADLAVITKADLAGAVGFRREETLDNIQDVRPGLEVIETSTRNGTGMDAWLQRLKNLRSHQSPRHTSSNVSARPRDDRSQLYTFIVAIVVLHLAGWGLVRYSVISGSSFLLGLAGLAYSFGLRHAFDADHIAAIDNATRKLMDDGERPYGVGFYFSLGHSTIVLALTLAVATATRWAASALPSIQAFGSYAGTTISGVFLYAIGLANLVVMVDVWRVFQSIRRGGRYDAALLEGSLRSRGWMSRCFGRLFNIVSRPRDMYWVGLLFGLGFDTATEVALLTVAGVAASQALPLTAVLSLPLVFAAGMTLIDSLDGVMMCGAYGWAFVNPVRKIFYNLTITGLSVVVALFVGTVELASIVGGRLLGVHSGFLGALQQIDLHRMGYLVAALCGTCWLLSMAIWRWARLVEREPTIR